MYVRSSGSLSTILRKVSTVVFAALTLVFVSVPSAGQGIEILDKGLPSIYLAYKESAERTRGKGMVLLELHNNTNININVSANFSTESAPTIEDGRFESSDGSFGTFLKSGSEVELCYDAEGLFVQKDYAMPRKTPNPRITDLRNSCSYRSNGKRVDDPYSMGYWIRSKEFVRFRVPITLLREGLKVYTEFRYPWEFTNSRVSLNEPKHRVYFFYFDILGSE